MFMEERLEKIYEILKRDNNVKVKDLSLEFNVSEGMIRKEHYGDICLTALGIQTAHQLYNQSSILQHFLRNHLGIDSETARKDAVSCITILSKDTLDRLSVLSLSEAAKE